MSQSLRLLGIVLILVIIALGGLFFLAKDALPGEALYGMKTGFVEEVGLMMQFSPENKLAYRTQLYEERLHEVQYLIVTKRLTPETASVIQSEMQELLTEAQAMYTSSEVDTITALQSSQDFLSMSKAIAALSYKEVADEAHAGFNDLAETAIDSNLDARMALVNLNDFTIVEQYVTEQLAELQGLLDDANLTQLALQDIQSFLTKAMEALAAGEGNRALSFVNSARELLDLSTYQTLPLDEVVPPTAADLEGEG